MFLAYVGLLATLSVTIFLIWLTISALEEAMRGPDPKVAWPAFVVFWLLTLASAALLFWQPLHWQGRA